VTSRNAISNRASDRPAVDVADSRLGSLAEDVVTTRKYRIARSDLIKLAPGRGTDIGDKPTWGARRRSGESDLLRHGQDCGQGREQLSSLHEILTCPYEDVGPYLREDDPGDKVRRQVTLRPLIGVE
jgi:hypothetical protein